MRISEGNHVSARYAWKTTTFGVVIDLIVSEYYEQNTLCTKVNKTVHISYLW
jgi:hypothetical protein